MERDEERSEDAPEEGQGLKKPSEVAPAEPGTKAGPAGASPAPGAEAGPPEAPVEPGIEAGPAVASPELGTKAGPAGASPAPGAEAGPPEAPVEPGTEAGPPEAPAEPGTEARDDRARGGLGRYVPAAGVSAAVLLFALAFFAAGFWVHAVLDDDEGSSATAGTSSDDPAWGPEDAAVTIEEFGDFQCPYCGRFAEEAMPTLRNLYGDRVRYVYRDFPLVSIHEFAQKAAEAAQCAHDQGGFWQYHDLLFANQSALTVLDLKEYARQVDMDSEAFDECLDSGKNAWEVLLDTRDGLESGVSGTPAFLINGVLIPGALPLEQFVAIIDQALAGAE